MRAKLNLNFSVIVKVESEQNNFEMELKEELVDEDSLPESVDEKLSVVKNEIDVKTTKRKRKSKRGDSKVPKCCMCGVEFRSTIELSQHCQEIHPDGVPENKNITSRHKYGCEYCKRKFRLKQFVLNHLQDVNFVEPPRDRKKEIEGKRKRLSEGRRICSICGLELSDQLCLEVHEATKHGATRNFKCSIDGCNSSFGHKVVLDKHKRVCHGKKKSRYVCSL